MRTLIAGLVAGIVVFAWGFVAHTVLPTKDMGLKILPNEDAVVSALNQSIRERGVYFFPGMDMRRKPSKAEEDAWTAKIKAGPTGLLVYQPGPGQTFSPKPLLVELLSNILAAILVAIVVSGLPGFGPRVIAGILFGLFAWLSISVSYWNWYGFSDAFTCSELVDQLGGWFFGGLVIAALTRTRVKA